MKYTGALALALVLLQTGCVSFDTVPEMYARSQWKGRAAQDAINFFGPPQKMDRTADDQHVVMQWYRDTSYNSNEVVAQSAERQGNVMVHTNYWATVNNPNRCILSITVDQDRKVVGFEADEGELLLSSGCQSVKFGPP
ncbi:MULTISPECIES: hypothetical protein [Pseudomonas]|uniref:hypothetical protein n=1 Tax=Pseudomonas TaxID=286 RepID=UPI00084AF070|nr:MULTISPECIES: hypothetical protein [Pseudomonas]OEC55285.1 hypothetical protein A7K61_23515 [Pseudomonas sp. AP42]OOV91188.1 hypothetical protein MF6394_29190 [Pseudomonas sp. MF6394]